MNVLARVEHTCARFVESAFARVFPSDVDAAHVGRKLVASLHATAGDLYLVRVHPVDYARFAPDRAQIEARWSALLREALPASRQAETPRALLHEDVRVVAGAVTIEAVRHEPAVPSLERADGSRIALRDGLRIGRSAQNDVVLVDPRVSRRHARIVAQAGGFAIEDCGSSNGTFINGAPTVGALLVPGTTVTIGDTHLRVRDDDG